MHYPYCETRIPNGRIRPRPTRLQNSRTAADQAQQDEIYCEIINSASEWTKMYPYRRCSAMRWCGWISGPMTEENTCMWWNQSFRDAVLFSMLLNIDRTFAMNEWICILLSRWAAAWLTVGQCILILEHSYLMLMAATLSGQECWL